MAHREIQLPPVAPIVTVQLALMPDGKIHVNGQGPLSAYVINGLLETAKQLLLAKVAGPKVEAAPPGVSF